MPQGPQQRYMSDMPVPQLSHSTRPVLLLRLSTLGLSPSASCTCNIDMLRHTVEPSPTPPKISTRATNVVLDTLKSR